MSNVVSLTELRLKAEVRVEAYRDPRLDWELRSGGPRVLFGETALPGVDLRLIAAAAGAVDIEVREEPGGAVRASADIAEWDLRLELVRHRHRPGQRLAVPAPVMHAERFDVLCGQLSDQERAEHAAMLRERTRCGLRLAERGFVPVGTSSRRTTHSAGRYTETLTDFYRLDYDAVAFQHVLAHLERRAHTHAATQLTAGGAR